jgi:hypothetical protein
MLYRWDEFLEEGEQLHNYMINNFDNMFDENKIKHFSIRDDYYANINYGKNIMIEYNKDIQIELIPWIRKEFKEGRLFNKEFWKPFRDYNLVDMFYGYKYLFQYKHYYFQLAMETYCELYYDEPYPCKYCDNLNEDDISPHFCLELYGWIDNKYDKLQPWNRILIPENNIIPETYWNIK